MEPIIITIPQFVRKIQVSEKQRAVYYEWNGIFIKGKGRKIPVFFFKDKKNIPKFPNLEDLKEGYFIGAFIGNKLIKSFTSTAFIEYHKSVYEEKANKKCRYYLCTDNNGMFSQESCKPILCNPKKVGKPKHYLIKGQDIYSGNLREHFRGMVMDKIKECYYPYVKDLPVIDSYPIKIECDLYDTVKNSYDKTGDLGQPWDVDNYCYPYMKAFPDILVREGKLRNDDRLHFPSSIHVRFFPIKDHSKRKLVFTISLDERSEIAEDEDFIRFHNQRSGVHKNLITHETEDNELANLNFDTENETI
jgi:hypothetical protein